MQCRNGDENAQTAMHEVFKELRQRISIFFSIFRVIQAFYITFRLHCLPLEEFRFAL